jgi:ABC-type spermidine/putrescine transport system permease subunit I
MVLEEYLQGDLAPERLPPAWISSTQFIFQSDDGGLTLYNSSSDNLTQILNNHTVVSNIFTSFRIALISTPRTGLISTPRTGLIRKM